MILQAVLKVPEGTNVFAQDETGAYVIGDEVFAQLALMAPQWPRGLFPGCRATGGYELVHALLDTDSEDPATLIDSLIAISAPDWELLSTMQTATR